MPGCHLPSPRFYSRWNFFVEKSVEIKDKYRTAIPKILIHHCIHFKILKYNFSLIFM